MGIGRFVYTPILPFMLDGTRLSADDAGLIASANFLGYLVGALAGSMGGLPGSSRAWFLGALLVSAISSIAMGFGEGLTAFVALRFIGGGASAFVLVFSSALVLDRLRDAGRADLSAVHFAGVGCGIAFSAILIAGLGHLGADWQGLWYASGTATLLLLGLSALLVPAASPAPSPAAALPMREACTSPFDAPLIRLIAAYGLFGFGYVITATFVSALARSTPALQASEPYVWLVVGLAAAPSIFVWNRVSVTIGPRKAFSLACIVEAVGVSLTVLSQQPLVFVLGAGLLGATFMGITALGLMEARAHAGRQGHANPRQILAIMTASFGLGQMAGPWFAGELHALTGSFQTPTLFAAAALLVAAALVFR